MLKTDIGQSTIFLYLEYFLKLVLGFSISALITRQLGPIESGKLSFVISFSTIFMPLYLMGINEFTVQDLVNKPEQKQQVLGTSFVIKLVGGLLAVLLTAISFLFLDVNDELKPFILLNSSFLCFKAFEAIDNWFLSRVEAKKISIARNLTLIITFSIKFYLWLKKSHWNDYIYVSLLEPLLYAITYVSLYQKMGNKIMSWKFDFNISKSYLKKCFTFLLLTILSTLIFKIDQIFIEKKLSSEVLGNYLAAVKLIEIWQFAPMILISVLFPKLVEKSKNQEDFNIGKMKYYSLITLPSFLFCCMVSVISSPLINFLYGSSFVMAAKYLSTYNWIVLFLYFWWARMRISIIQNELKIEIYTALLAIVILIVCLFLLFNKLGDNTTIVSLLICLVLSNVIVSFFNRYIRSSIFDFIKSFNFYPLLKPYLKSK